MKQYLFEDLGKKYTAAQLAKIEGEVLVMEKRLHMRKEILRISDIRETAIDYWNAATPEERANFGKSKEEIEQGENAKRRSMFNFEGVANMQFSELSEFWKAIWFSSTVAHFEKEALK